MNFTFLLKPLAYIFIMILGALLRGRGLIKEGDHKLLSFIVLTLTLPAAVIRAFAQVESTATFYWIVLMGFSFTTIPLIFTYLASMRMDKKLRVYSMINMSGYNIGCFALPIIQEFFGATGAVIACMFDVGNGIMSSSGTYSVTSTVLQTNPNDPPTLKAILKKFFTSIPFVTYLAMIALSILNLKIPAQIIAVIDPIASANSFLAMFMVGAMFKLKAENGYLKPTIKLIASRYAFCAVCAAFCIFALPFDPMMKRILAMLCFAPIASLAPMYTDKAGGDGALASFTNSISVIASLIAMTVLAVLPM